MTKLFEACFRGERPGRTRWPRCLASRKESILRARDPRRPGSCPPAGQEARSSQGVAKVENAIRTHLSAGKGILKVAALVGVGSGTVQRVKREMVATMAEAA